MTSRADRDSSRATPEPAVGGRWPKVKVFLPAAAYMLLIAFMSSRPSPEFATLFPMWLGIKTLHVLEFGLLALLLARGMFRVTAWKASRIYFLAILLTTAYGVSDEVHQLFVPGRSARAGDVVADCIGALIFARLHPVAARWHGFSFLRFRPSAAP